MNLQECNPYVRAAQIQPAVLEGTGLRMAYDHRIFYILEGEGMLITEDASHFIAADCMLYLCPRTGYYFKGRMRVAVLNFDLTRKAAHRTDPICPPPAAEFDPLKCFDSTVLENVGKIQIQENQRFLREDLLQLVNTFRKKDAWTDAMTSALLKKLLADYFGAARQSMDSESLLARRVERYIELYAAEIQSNETIGRAFGYHPGYIAEIFRKITGQTLHQAVLQRRIELSCQLLLRTDYSIEAIAFDAGFSSRSYFCTVFKAITGYSPKKYREQKKP